MPSNPGDGTGSEPGLLGKAILKRYRRANTRKLQAQRLIQLRIRYRSKVLEEKKTRAQLLDLENAIRRLERTLNHRAFEFTRIFDEASDSPDNDLRHQAS